ncbi:MAG: beta-lactamase family protein, partial [Alphaproteobacteria bacterium]|nr:beta-lactamase family protein [Alphaproteobacteria bacterium]
AYVSHQGRTLLSAGAGAARADTLVPWASACKPTTVAAVLRLVEAGEVGLHDKVTRFIPGFGVNGKAEVEIFHLMTHTAQLGGYTGPIDIKPWDEMIAPIVAAPRESAEAGRARLGAARQGGAPAELPPPPPLGTMPSYNPAGIWILGEILRIVHDRPFSEVIRTELYLPCGMAESWNGMPDDRFAAYGERIARPRGRAGSPQTRAEFAGFANPAGGAVGPLAELGRFYEIMLAGGETGTGQILRPETIAEMTRVQASDGGVWVFGLGFHLNAAPVVPLSERAARLRYGAKASPATFGHNGATGVIAFADPAHGLVLSTIGLPASFVDTVYEELGLA